MRETATWPFSIGDFDMNFEIPSCPIIRPITAETGNEIMDEVAGHVGTLVNNARTSLELQWVIGRALLKAKSKFKHGEWIPALRSRGIKERSARRWMQAAKAIEHAPISDDELDAYNEALVQATQEGGEEEEISEDVQTDAFAKPDASKRVLCCAECQRNQRVGNPIAERCKECARIVKEFSPWTGAKGKRKKIKAKGSFSPYSYGSPLTGTERHLMNLCIDFGLPTDQENSPEFLRRGRLLLRDLKQIAVEARKELKKKAKGPCEVASGTPQTDAQAPAERDAPA
jgi:hypothetical protein